MAGRARRAFGLYLLLGLQAGCGAPPDEHLQRTEQPVIIGNWMFNLRNGEVGPNPVLLNNRCPGGICPLAVCAVQKPDGRWHAGKLWEGKCRFEYGNKFDWLDTYAVLQHPTSGSLARQDDPSIPHNAIVTPNGPQPGMPVCSLNIASFGLGFATGKVWNGSCRAEYDNTIWTRTWPDFDYVVHVE